MSLTDAVLNWFTDTMASSDIIDLYFVVSDLKDIPISEAERAETAYYDSMASQVASNHGGDSDIPLGKLVF